MTIEVQPERKSRHVFYARALITREIMRSRGCAMKYCMGNDLNWTRITVPGSPSHSSDLLKIPSEKKNRSNANSRGGGGGGGGGLPFERDRDALRLA